MHHFFTLVNYYRFRSQGKRCTVPCTSHAGAWDIAWDRHGISMGSGSHLIPCSFVNFVQSTAWDADPTQSHADPKIIPCKKTHGMNNLKIPCYPTPIPCMSHSHMQAKHKIEHRLHGIPSHADPMSIPCTNSAWDPHRTDAHAVCYFFASAVPRCRPMLHRTKKKFAARNKRNVLLEEIVLRVASTPVLPRV